MSEPSTEPVSGSRQLLAKADFRRVYPRERRGSSEMRSSSSRCSLTSATQESVDESVLGRAMGIIFLGSFGAKPVGLLLIAPLYAFLDPSVMFLVGGVAVFACAIAAAGLVDLATRRYRAAAAV